MALHTEPPRPAIDIENDDDTPKLFPDTETRRVAERYSSPFFRPNPSAVEAMRAVETALRPDPSISPNDEGLDGIDRRRPVLNSIGAVLTARKKLHGEFANDARTAQRLKAVMRDTVNWGALTDVQHEALENIATKIGRILSGNPNHIDHWSDIQGYARLVEERL